MMSSSNIAAFLSHPRIALLTPLRDEEDSIEAMIVSIVNQQIRPAKWLIVDDGSTDQTPAIVKRYCQEFHFIELLELPARSERNPGGEGAIALALQRLDLSQFDYLARFDADLLFERTISAEFQPNFTGPKTRNCRGRSLYRSKEEFIAGAGSRVSCSRRSEDVPKGMF